MKLVAVLLAALSAGALVGFLVGRSLPPAAAAGAGPPGTSLRPERSNDQGSQSAVAGARAKLAGGLLHDRYEAVLTLLEHADSNDAMFRIFQDSLPDTKLRYLVAQQWAEFDAPGMFERLLAEGVGNFHYNERPLFMAWGRDDPQAALRAIARLGALDRKNISELRNDALEGWLAGDPEGALRSGLDLDLDPYQASPRYTDWIEDDPDGAYQLLLDAPQSNLRRQGLARANALLAQRDPLAALERCDDLSGHERSTAIREVVDEWGRHDLEAALDWADENLFGTERTAALSSLYRESIGADPAAAVAMLDEVASPVLRERLADQIANRWGLEDPIAALAWATDEGESGGAHARTILQNWTNSDPAAVAAWILENGEPPNGGARPVAGSVASSLARRDPAAAIEWAVQLPEQQRGSVLWQVVGSVGYRAVPLLREQLHAVPPGQGRNSLLAMMGTCFRHADPQGAEAWFESLPEGDQSAARVRVRWE